MTDVLACAQSPSPSAPIYASPLRRFGAMFYDSLLCLAVWMAASALVLPFMSSGQTIEQLTGAQAIAYRVFLLIVLGLFFCYFWTKKGRTLGMQVWKLSVRTLTGDKPSWRQSIVRFAMACVPVIVADVTLTAVGKLVQLAIGWQMAVLIGMPLVSYLAGYFDSQRRALHERRLTTRIVRT